MRSRNMPRPCTPGILEAMRACPWRMGPMCAADTCPPAPEQEGELLRVAKEAGDEWHIMGYEHLPVPLDAPRAIMQRICLLRQAA